MGSETSSTLRRVWQILGPILLGLGLLVIFALAAGFAGGACHCNSPLGVLFPYASIAWGAYSWETFGSLLFIIQYPVYSLTLARVRGVVLQPVAILILLVAHIALAFVAVRVYQHG